MVEEWRQIDKIDLIMGMLEGMEGLLDLVFAIGVSTRK
jgi:hypothetical protein